VFDAIFTNGEMTEMQTSRKSFATEKNIDFVKVTEFKLMTLQFMCTCENISITFAIFEL